MTSLPILGQSQNDPPGMRGLRNPNMVGPPGNARLAVLVHALRMALLGTLIWTLHQSPRQDVEKESSKPFGEAELAVAKATWSTADQLRASERDATLCDVLDQQGQVVGRMARTAPLTDRIVGYAGPSNLAICLTPDGVIQQVEILHSADTREHVLKVKNDEAFWQQFRGWQWGKAATAEVDGVSGATLTSLAMAESMLVRLDEAERLASSPGSSPTNSPRRSLKFPTPITAEESLQLANKAARQNPELEWGELLIDQVTLLSEWEASLQGTGDRELGRVFRSGVLSDQVVGYQGPTELLICVDPSQMVLAATFRSTFDNEPYTRYVRQEASFWAKFIGRNCEELASLDLKAEGIEGVSGATMTSMAIAESLQASCRELSLHLQELNQPSVAASETKRQRTARWNLSWSELFTLVMALLSVAWSYSRWRGQRMTRLCWQMMCFVGLGWVSGNLLSLALFSGWTQGGIAWQLAPGLAMLLGLSLAAPMLLKKNIYCDQLCPHGIAQQWLRQLPHAGKAKRLASMEMGLNISGWLAITIALFSLWQRQALPVAWLEPFDAYVWRVGLSWSALVWLLSLTLSYFRPMAYCRHACPTGKVLTYLRFDRKRYQLHALDGALVTALAISWLW